MSATFPNAKIDIFVKGGLGPILFENYDSIGTVIQLPKKHFKQLSNYLKGWMSLRKYNYDIVFNVTKNSSSGRLSTKFAKGKFKFYNDDNLELKSKYSDYNHIAKYPIYNFRNYVSKLNVVSPNTAVPRLDIKLNDAELLNGKNIVKNLVKNDSKTLCLFTYATGTKCYSESWWMELYEKIKKTFPTYSIIEVLPVENVSQINFAEPTFYSHDIREIAAVIANTSIFIGADSGIMHLSSSVNAPTLGLFSITDPEIYEPYNDNSKGLNTNGISSDDIIKEIKIILSKAQI
jgi:ADP-heptose:LPS heptosyltransferase